MGKARTENRKKKWAWKKANYSTKMALANLLFKLKVIGPQLTRGASYDHYSW